MSKHLRSMFPRIDSSNGGIVSPIFEDGSMISVPIPSKDKDQFSDLQYNVI